MIFHAQTMKYILAIMSIGGWLFAGGGLLVMPYLYVDLGWSGVLPGLAAFTGGSVIIILYIIGLSVVETADKMARAVALLERPLPNSASTSLDVNSAASETLPRKSNLAVADEPPPIKIFKGHKILKSRVGVTVGGRPFDNVLAAEKWIKEKDSL